MDDNNSQYIYVGQFVQESNKMIVTDPWYHDDKLIIDDPLIKIPDNLLKVNNGLWNVWCKYDKDNLCATKLVALCSHLEFFGFSEQNSVKNIDWQKKSTINTTTRQIGIYDFKYFKNDDNVKGHELCKRYLDIVRYKGDKWYLANCHITETQKCGIIKNGAVASCCENNELYVFKNGSKILGIKIVSF